MDEVCQQILWNSLFPVCVCLNVMLTLGQSEIVGSLEFDEELGCDFGKMGATYMGSRNITKSGIPCQPWAEALPHEIDANIKDDQFPDESREEAKNFCRNPQPLNKSGVWCYTTNASVEWEYCDPCPEKFQNYSGCTLPDKGISYSAALNRTKSDAVCQPWSKYPDVEFTFPDGSAEKAENFCRNPKPRDFEAPWCYVKRGSSGEDLAEYCEVCLPFQGRVKKSIGSRNDPIKISSFALSDSNCISFCITYLSCQAAIILHGTKVGCFHVTSLGGKKISDAEVVQYEVNRVCTSRSKGGSAYFVNNPNVGTAQAHLFYKGTMDECDEQCVDFKKCALYVYDAKERLCYYSASLLKSFNFNYGITERLIVRCNPAVKAISYTTENSNPAARLEPSSSSTGGSNEVTGSRNNSQPASVSNPPAATQLPNASSSSPPATQSESPNDETAGDHVTANQTAEATKESKRKTILLIVLIAALCFGAVVVCVAGCVYYKLVVKADKKDSPGKVSKERKTLIDQKSAKKPQKLKTSPKKN